MIVLKAWCGDCTAEGVENPGRLGVVQREDDGSHRWMPTARNGCYLTIGHSMRGAVGRNKIGPEELSPLVMSTRACRASLSQSSCTAPANDTESAQ